MMPLIKLPVQTCNNGSALSLIVLWLIAISGCVGDTIVSKDHKTVLVALGATKKFSARTGAEINYTLTSGGNKQLSNRSLVIDGTRFEDTVTLKNRFYIQSITADYRFNAINADRFKFTLAPGVSLTQFSLDTSTDTFQSNENNAFGGYGMRLETSLKMSRDTQLKLYGAAYGYDNKYLTEVGLSGEFKFETDKTLSVGYAQHIVEQARKENADIILDTGGLHVGLDFSL